MKLSKTLIQSKLKKENILDAKELNLWGQNLTDISILRQLKSLEILSLSLNNLSTLKDLENCCHLKELYLRKNNISNFTELESLKGLTELRKLNLSENPVSEINGYREIVLKILPQIELLDDQEIIIENTQQQTLYGKKQDYRVNEQQQFSQTFNKVKTLHYNFSSYQEFLSGMKQLIRVISLILVSILKEFSIQKLGKFNILY